MSESKTEKIGTRIVVQPQDLVILEELKALTHCGSLSTAASLIISRYGKQLIEWWRRESDSLQGENDPLFVPAIAPAPAAPKTESRTTNQRLDF